MKKPKKNQSTNKPLHPDVRRGMQMPSGFDAEGRPVYGEKPKTPPRRAYVAVIDAKGRHKLGIAEEGEPGYYPLPDDSDLGGSYQSREHALSTAEEANKRLGLSKAEASAIVASSMGASMRAHPQCDR